MAKILSVVSKDSLPKIEEYNWLISNATTTINQTTSTPKIDISSLSSGEYNVCIQIDSAITHAETRYCKRITIEDDYSIVKNTFTLCETELPWFGASDTYGNKLLDVFGTHWRWDQGPIIWSDLQIGKNTFINERKDKCGCSYQQEITVIYRVRGKRAMIMMIQQSMTLYWMIVLARAQIRLVSHPIQHGIIVPTLQIKILMYGL
ncbi:MAG: hypothetical protein IPG00_22290 [Saprospiraceae bacterium]|nr:hypothetical protein [Saprospiraceae bacterium]